MYNEFQIYISESDECLTKGICSINPTLSSVQEIILLYLKELSFYLLKLKSFGITNDSIKNEFIYAIANIVSDAEYNQDQFHNLISKLYNDIEQSKTLYEKFCKENSLEIQTVKTYFKFSKNFTITDAIKKGEKYFIKKSQSMTQKQKDLFDIMLMLIKGMCIKIIEYERMCNEEEKDGYYAILTLLNSMILGDLSEEKMVKSIDDFIQVYYKIVKKVFYVQKELYGEITPTEVSFSTHLGKAILVSGTDFNKLERILKATEGLNINVYTHGLEMLMAHAYPKLKAFSNLKGHFGSGLDSAMVDFASFPGAILMTKSTLQKVEYLYRGRLFSLDPIPPRGVVKIINNDFEPLIKSALDAKGFTFTKEKAPLIVGYNKTEVMNTIDKVIEKITNKEINYLFIVGLLNAPNLIYKPYFEKLFETISKDSFVFSMCCPISKDNVYHLDSFFDYSLFYQLLKRIQTKISISEINMTVYLTRCDKHTVANLLYLKRLGIKNVFMCKCSNNLLNPSLVKTLQDIFGIKEISDVSRDLEEIIKIKE